MLLSGTDLLKEKIATLSVDDVIILLSHWSMHKILANMSDI